MLNLMMSFVVIHPKSFSRITMKPYTILFSFAIFFLNTLIAQSQAPQSTQELRTVALQQLRDFRDVLSNLTPSTNRDETLKSTNSFISLSKTCNDRFQLESYSAYFYAAQKQLSAATNKEQAVEYISSDLKLKLSSTDTSLKWQAYPTIFKNYKVGVNAKVVNATGAGPYVIYWAQFTGLDQESLITSMSYNGTSTTSGNPYSLIIKLPGYITFWLKDVATGKLYKADPDHFPLPKGDQDIDVNFVPFK